MKKLIILFILLIFSINLLVAEKLRLGICGAGELSDKSEFEDIFNLPDNKYKIMPGFYWELIFDHMGFGMTYYIKFLREESSYPGVTHEWLFDWIGSFDFRYHFLTKFILDPFIEFSLGNAGRVDLTDYKQYTPEHTNPVCMSLFAQFGLGLAVRLKTFHIGAKLVRRIMNDPVPATQFDTYPLADFQFSMLLGLSL